MSNDYDKLPPGNGLPPPVKVGSMNKHAIIDITLAVVGIMMALPGVYYFLEQKDNMREIAERIRVMEVMTNAIVSAQYERDQLLEAYKQNIRHVQAFSSGVQQFLTNQSISEIEVAPDRISIFRTNKAFGPPWEFQVTATNVIARKKPVPIGVVTQAN